MGQGQVRGAVVDHDYDYVDHVTGQRKLAALDQKAVHSIDVHTLKRHTARHWDFVKRQLWLNGCTLPTTGPDAVFARVIVDQARRIASDVANERSDVPDAMWQGPLGHDALSALLEEWQPEGLFSRISALAEGVSRLLNKEPSLGEAEVPAKIFGDLHGQFRDMLLLLQDFDFPEAGGASYIFNGDWVDRGKHQLEVVTLIFAMKLSFPEKVFLVRGNHEDGVQNQHMGAQGFQQACIARLGDHFGMMIFDIISKVFDWLPLGCIVGERILVVHGGIGEGNWHLDYLAGAPRPLTHDMLARDPVLYNVLWSDPIPEDTHDCFGVHDSPRDDHGHLIRMFGKDVTDAFCQVNGLDMIVRSHQAKLQGCGYEVMHGGRCVRVFSARDYEGSCNDGSILSITHEDEMLVVRPQVLRSMDKLAQKGAVAAAVVAPPRAAAVPTAATRESLGYGSFDSTGYNYGRDLSQVAVPPRGPPPARAPPPPPPAAENPFHLVYDGHGAACAVAGVVASRGSSSQAGVPLAASAATDALLSRGSFPAAGGNQLLANPYGPPPTNEYGPSPTNGYGTVPHGQPHVQPQTQAGQPLALGQFMSKLRVAPCGVLGSQLLRDQRVVQTGELPDATTVITDVVGVHLVQPPGGPSQAGGMDAYAGSIYAWLEIATNMHFPPDVVQGVTADGEAKYHAYDARKHAIHVAPPDLRQGVGSADAAVVEFANAYCNILREFSRCGMQSLRLAPLASSATVGQLGQQLPSLIVAALRRGFQQLQPPEQQVVLAREVRLCIFAEVELGQYESEVRASAPVASHRAW